MEAKSGTLTLKEADSEKTKAGLGILTDVEVMELRKITYLHQKAVANQFISMQS